MQQTSILWLFKGKVLNYSELIYIVCMTKCSFLWHLLRLFFSHQPYNNHCSQPKCDSPISMVTLTSSLYLSVLPLQWTIVTNFWLQCWSSIVTMAIPSQLEGFLHALELVFWYASKWHFDITWWLHHYARVGYVHTYMYMYELWKPATLLYISMEIPNTHSGK